MRHNVHHCLAVLHVVKDYDVSVIDAQREANYLQNKERDAAKQMQTWTAAHVPQDQVKTVSEA